MPIAVRRRAASLPLAVPALSALFILACRDVSAPPREVGGGSAGLDVAPVASQLETFHGPRRFTRDRGQPAQAVDLFSTAGFEAPFVVRIRSGNGEGEHRVSSARVAIDGREVLGPSSFSQTESEWTVPVALDASAVLSVTVAGAPGAYLDIRVEGKRSATLFCPNGRPGSVIDIRQAIAQTAPGGVVEICDGTHTVRNVLLTKPITIRGAGPGIPVLDPGSQSPIFQVQDPSPGAVVVRGLELVVRGAMGVFVSDANDDVSIDRTIFRMTPTATSATGGTGIFLAHLNPAPAAPTALVTITRSEFHGGFRGLDVGSAMLRVEASGNRFVQPHPQGFAIGVSPFGRLIATHNSFQGCGQSCVGSGGGSIVDFDDNAITVDIDAPAMMVVNAGNTGSIMRMSRNTIIGVGGDPAHPDPARRYAIHTAVQANQGASIMGTDNVIRGANTPITGYGKVTMHRSDIVGYMLPFTGSNISDLRCNWWGSALGPTGYLNNAPASVYAPWASQPIAGTTIACEL